MSSDITLPAPTPAAADTAPPARLMSTDGTKLGIGDRCWFLGIPTLPGDAPDGVVAHEVLHRGLDEMRGLDRPRLDPATEALAVQLRSGIIHAIEADGLFVVRCDDAPAAPWPVVLLPRRTFATRLACIESRALALRALADAAARELAKWEAMRWAERRAVGAVGAVCPPSGAEAAS